MESTYFQNTTVLFNGLFLFIVDSESVSVNVVDKKHKS